MFPAVFHELATSGSIGVFLVCERVGVGGGMVGAGFRVYSDPK